MDLNANKMNEKQINKLEKALLVAMITMTIFCVISGIVVLTLL